MNDKLSILHSVVGRRIYGLFVVCALLPVCALAAISLLQVAGTAKTESRNRLHHASKNAGMTIMEILFLLQTELTSYAREISGVTPGQLRELASPTRGEDFQRLLALTLFPQRGTPRTFLGTPCPRPALTPGDKRHLASGKALLFSEPAAKRGRRLFLAVALERGRPGSGMLVGEINTSYLWSLAENTHLPATDLYVTDADGGILYATSSAPPFIPRVQAGLHSSSVGHFEWHRRNRDDLVDYWSVFLSPQYQTPSWTVIVSQSTDDALRPLHLFGRTFALVVSLTLIVVSYLSSILIRRNLIPLATLRQGARRLGRGDLDARVAIRSGDEFEELATTFNGMADHLQRQFTTLQGTGQLVQQVLSAQDQDAIVAIVMSALETVVSCQAQALSLLDPTVTDFAVTHYNRQPDAGSDHPTVAMTTFAEGDLDRCTGAEFLHFTDCSQFAALLAPLENRGAREFYLFPFFIKGTLAGLLTIGYRQPSSQLREDLTRARQVADEIAVALDNVRLIEELNQLNRGTIRALANAVDAKSPWTAGHSERVTQLALSIGRAMGLSAREQELLQLGGMLHDIGKIAVPEAILDKNGRLTEEEYALIRTHSEAGAHILEPILAYEEVIPTVAQHHEWYNGKGYPRGLAGEEIVLGARILAVADVCDALASDRPYRPGWDKDRVLAHIGEKAGSQFDPRVVAAFFTIADDCLTGMTADDRVSAGTVEVMP